MFICFLALKQKATSGVAVSDKVNATAKQGDGKTESVQLQTLSAQTLSNQNANNDQPMTIKAESPEPIQGKATDSQEPMKSKAESPEPTEGKATDSQEPMKSKAESPEPIEGKATDSQEPMKSKAESPEPIEGKATDSQEPMKKKAESPEPIGGEATDNQEPMKSKPSDSHLSNGKNVAKTIEAATEAPSSSAVLAEDQREVETAKILPEVQEKTEGDALKTNNEVVLPSNAIKAEDEDSGGKAESVPEANNDGEESSYLPLERAGSKTEQQANAIAKEIEFEADGIREVEAHAINVPSFIEESDVTNEIKADIINQVQSDVSDNAELDVMCKPAVAAKPFQVSTTFGASVEATLTTAGEDYEGEATFTEAVNLPAQNVATATATSSTNAAKDTMVTDHADVTDIIIGVDLSVKAECEEHWNEVDISPSQGGSKISEAKDVIGERQSGHDVATESAEFRSESEETNQQQEVSDIEQAEETTDDLAITEAGEERYNVVDDGES